MSNLINEAKRMQHLAGIINESQLNEDILELKQMSKQLYSFLKKKGFDPGPIDGDIGLKTLSAMKSYLSANMTPMVEKTVEKTKTEPHTTYFSWKLPEISGAGFQLLFFNTLFSDDLNRGFYESFIILSGYQHSSTADLNMIDVMAVLILNRYGGKLHNPQRIEKISTNYLLSGEVYSPFLIKNP